MYVPKAFKMEDWNTIYQFIRVHSFGILMSHDGTAPLATHIPFYCDASGQTLKGHVARANPHWKSLDDQTVLIVFSGPHAYISPSWYQIQNSVPTWNYTAVHVVGKCRIIQDDAEVQTLLEQTVRFYEPDSDLPERADEEFYQNMMKAIVGLKIEITDIQGVEKLSQNKPQAVQQRVSERLLASSNDGDGAVGRLMEQRLANRPLTDDNR